jgi:proteasome lid subunit RPN8/RPN11
MTLERLRRSAGGSPALGGDNILDAARLAALRHDSLALPANLKQQLVSEARSAYPNECCGLPEGARRDGIIEALKLHPTRNLAKRVDRFEVDPMEQFRLLHALRGTERDIVGCYHSHPNGAPVPSAFDLEMAAEDDFVWLIAAVRADGGSEIAAHLFAGGKFFPLSLT